MNKGKQLFFFGVKIYCTVGPINLNSLHIKAFFSPLYEIFNSQFQAVRGSDKYNK